MHTQHAVKFGLYLCLLYIHAPILAQVQMGNTLEGAGTNDVMGYSVDIAGDGNRIIVGSRYSSNPERGSSGRFSGHANIYEWDGSNWVEMGSPIYGTGREDLSGSAVSISKQGNIIAIGAPYSNTNGSDAGQVRVFKWVNNNWVQLGNDLRGSNPGDRAGSSVTLSADGKIVAIGAIRNDEAGSNAGQVRIYRWQSNTWVQMGNALNGSQAGEQFGVEVDLSDDGFTLAIGGNGNDHTDRNAGYAKVYRFNGTDWTQRGQDIYGIYKGGELGAGLALSGNGEVVAVGSPRGDHDINALGYVQVFEWGNASWNQIGSTIFGENRNDYFGYAISLSDNGRILAVGSPFNRDNGYFTGHTKSYQNRNNSWEQIGTTLYGETAVELSGYAVKLSGDGTKIVIGACEFIADGSFVGNGKARVFDLFGLISNSSELNVSTNITLHPNPATNYLRISGAALSYEVRIYDINGRTQAYIPNYQNGATLNLSPYGLGYYSLSIRPKGEEHWLSKSFIKK
ncbi:MAG: hypothetical protein HRU41_22845 [Saprospiraceae bacterium]|nr:hypothetical protein [Saprospiraceae bacterium]